MTFDLDIVSSEIIADNGTRLAFESFGEKADPLLVLIQGYTAQLVGWPAGFCIELASKGFHVVRFDNRDVGLSQKFPGIEYSIGDMADDVAGLITALGYSTGHVVGQSMGGMIAQEVALRHPDKVASLTIFYSTAHAARHLASDIDDVNAPQVVSSMQEAVANYVENESHVFEGNFPLDSGLLWEMGLRYVQRGWDPEGCSRQTAALRNDRDRADDLRQLTCPTLIIHGTEDPLISVEGGIELAELIPGARLDVIEGMVHSIPHQLWERFITAISTTAGVSH